jgi:hypothetical protein
MASGLPEHPHTNPKLPDRFRLRPKIRNAEIKKKG